MTSLLIQAEEFDALLYKAVTDAATPRLDRAMFVLT
jgi:hypothetical protein